MRAEPKLWSARDLSFSDATEAAYKFAQNVTPGDSESCWLWTGWINKGGYGQLRTGYGRKGVRYVFAHRIAWVLGNERGLSGELSIDHLCEVRACVNPAHLEPVTIYENRRRVRNRREPDDVERQVLELVGASPLGEGRNAHGCIQRICALCEVTYPTDYLADHIRRHVLAGSEFRSRKVGPPKQGAA